MAPSPMKVCERERGRDGAAGMDVWSEGGTDGEREVMRGGMDRRMERGRDRWSEGDTDGWRE